MPLIAMPLTGTFFTAVLFTAVPLTGATPTAVPHTAMATLQTHNRYRLRRPRPTERASMAVI